MRVYQVRVDIYEAATGYAYPVVTHLFHGRTMKEARSYHDAHKRADAFLRECEDKQSFAGTVRCRAVRRERWLTVQAH